MAGERRKKERKKKEGKITIIVAYLSCSVGFMHFAHTNTTLFW
jgi:hypothetical protein